MIRVFSLYLFCAFITSCNAQTGKINSEVKTKQNMSKAILASGCFWGTEYFLKRVEGVLSTQVGYTGGFVENPTYEQVCSKRTGHYEASEIIFDIEKTN